MYRSRIKKKTTEIKAAYGKSGVNGTSALKGLTDLEQRVLSIISDAAVDGDGTTRECGRAISTVSILEYQQIFYLF